MRGKPAKITLVENYFKKYVKIKRLSERFSASIIFTFFLFKL